MSAVNPFSPPQAHVADVHATVPEFSEPKVWSYRGRIGRLRFLSYTTVGYLCIIPAVMLLGFLGAIAGDESLASIAALAASVPYIVLYVLALIQRSHDMGWSGWTALLTLIPLVIFVWIFKSGTPGANRFGAPPPPNTTGVKVGAFMLVALVVLGILAAIAIPAYADYVQRAAATANANP